MRLDHERPVVIEAAQGVQLGTIEGQGNTRLGASRQNRGRDGGNRPGCWLYELVDGLHQRRGVHRFRQIAAEAQFLGGGPCLPGGVGAQRHDRRQVRGRMREAQELDQLESAHARHVDIGENEIEALRFQPLQHLVSTRDDHHLVARSPEDSANHLLVRTNVLGEQDSARAARAKSCGHLRRLRRRRLLRSHERYGEAGREPLVIDRSRQIGQSDAGARAPAIPQRQDVDRSRSAVRGQACRQLGRLDVCAVRTEQDREAAGRRP